MSLSCEVWCQLLFQSAASVMQRRMHVGLIDAERLGDFRREFGRALLLDDHGGVLGAALQGRVGAMTRCDPQGDGPGAPFGAEASVDLVVSLLSLHWINDLPGVLAGVARVLVAVGLFFWGQYGGHGHEGAWPEDHYEPKRFFCKRPLLHVLAE